MDNEKKINELNDEKLADVTGGAELFPEDIRFDPDSPIPKFDPSVFDIDPKDIPNICAECGPTMTPNGIICTKPDKKGTFKECVGCPANE